MIVLIGLFALATAFLAARLFWFQTVAAGELAYLAMEERTVKLLPETNRGRILDRHFEPLGRGREAVALVAYSDIARAGDGELSRLADLLGMSLPELTERIAAVKVRPVLLKREVDGLEKELSALGVPGLALVPWTGRYGKDPLAVHATGYVVDGTGADGLERVFDDYLKGQAGYGGTVVDARGKPLLGLSTGSPLVGKDVVTTIDGRVQEVVEEALDRLVDRGAVMVVDPGTGDVLAAASRPRYDPDDPGPYLAEEGSPFLDRTLVAYPPGSVFKLVVAAAALETGAVGPLSRFDCSGKVVVDGRPFKCYRQEGHGELSLAGALAESCNASLIEVGLTTGREAILEQARRLGFGELTGIGLPQEEAGYLPGPGDTGERAVANLSIGQGYLGVTVAQVARMTATIASGGIDRSLRLVRGITRPAESGVKVLKSFPYPEERRVLSRETASFLAYSMRAVVSRGTAGDRGIDDSAGKTGTAEVAGSNPHAWFAGFWPGTDPRYVIVVLVENGGSGAEGAVPVFAEIIRSLQ